MIMEGAPKKPWTALQGVAFLGLLSSPLFALVAFTCSMANHDMGNYYAARDAALRGDCRQARSLVSGNNSGRMTPPEVTHLCIVDNHLR